MSTKYKATTTEEAYFITITTIGWVDIFTRLNQKQIIIQALQYCQVQKGDRGYVRPHCWTDEISQQLKTLT